MNKKQIRLTEQVLHRIIKESVNKMLKENYVNEIIEKYGNPPYTAYFRYEGFWDACNDPKYLEDYILDVEKHYSSTMGECGQASICNGDEEEIFTIG